jgi:uncharacterized membrane protein YfbV (UPF0208 family)
VNRDNLHGAAANLPLKIVQSLEVVPSRNLGASIDIADTRPLLQALAQRLERAFQKITRIVVRPAKVVMSGEAPSAF